MTHQRGFSLIDVSVLVAVLGLLAASLLSSNNVRQEMVRLSATEQRMDDADAAIRQFFLENGRLPCPASLTVRPGTDPFGGEVLYAREPTGTRACGGTVTPTFATVGIDERQRGAVTQRVRLGMLPTRSLGLPDSAGYDEWGNRLWYVVYEELAVSSASFNAFVSPTVSNPGLAFTALPIQLSSDGAGTPAVTVSSDDSIAYLIFSTGRDRQGAFSPTGQLVTICANLGDPNRNRDSQNCDGGFVYVSANIDETPGANFFYDITRFALLNEFR